MGAFHTHELCDTACNNACSKTPGCDYATVSHFRYEVGSGQTTDSSAKAVIIFYQIFRHSVWLIYSKWWPYLGQQAYPRMLILCSISTKHGVYMCYFHQKTLKWHLWDAYCFSIAIVPTLQSQYYWLWQVTAVRWENQYIAPSDMPYEKRISAGKQKVGHKYGILRKRIVLFLEY